MASVRTRLAHSLQASARLHVSRSAGTPGRARHPGVPGVFRDAALAGQNAAMRRGMSSGAEPVYDVSSAPSDMDTIQQLSLREWQAPATISL
jgi:hypothetical protein